MKNSILVLALILGVSCANDKKTKESEVPEVVKSAFSTNFPEVKDADWEKEGDNNYEVGFEVNETETSVVFDGTGKLLETEVEIPAAELPASVKEYLDKNFAGKKIDEAAKITNADGAINYEAEIDHKDYIFDANGSLVKIKYLNSQPAILYRLFF